MGPQRFGSHIYKEAVFRNSGHYRLVEHIWFYGYTFFVELPKILIFYKSYTKDDVKIM